MAGRSSERKRISKAATAKSSTTAESESLITTTMPLRSRASEAAQQHVSSDPPLSIRQAAARSESDHEDPAPAQSSDDEAPEAISQSTSKAQLREREIAQSKAIKEAESRSRTKRKERQQRLDEQAKVRTAKRQRQLLAEEEERLAQQSEEDDGEEEDDESVEEFVAGDLLPASLLAQLSDVRPATPPPDDTEAQNKKKLQLSRRRQAQLTKRNIVTLPSKGAPRDLELGSVRVRVLSQRNERLPPPKSKSKLHHAMGSWMRGRPTIARASTAKRKGVKVTSGRVQRKPFGLKAAFF